MRANLRRPMDYHVRHQFALLTQLHACAHHAIRPYVQVECTCALGSINAVDGSFDLLG